MENVPDLETDSGHHPGSRSPDGVCVSLGCGGEDSGLKSS